MFDSLSIVSYNGYFRFANNSVPSSRRLKEFIEIFSQKTGNEPYVNDENNNIYYHPYLFHFIAVLSDVDYFLSTAKILTEMKTQDVKQIGPTEKKSSSASKETKQTKEMSSYNIGKHGETFVLDTIREVKPHYEISTVSATGHVGDIHVNDNVNMIKYLIEVKEKTVITKDDITKFDNDMKLLKQTNSLQYKNIYGIFISLETDTIPSIGKYKITNNYVYLGKSMFNKDILTIIFSMMESLCVLSEVSTNRITYDIPVKVYELISRLRLEYNIIINEEEIYKNMITNCESNLLSVNKLQRNNMIKKDFIRFINDEFSNILPIIDNGVNRKEEDRLRAFLANKKKKDILKKTLMDDFPSFRTELSSMKLTDFIDKYR